ncbi:bifunctional 2-polyprenyl-6-hydroxyphenol methylase/3-demethylubiquinol 3-O-methyltransferase UbiG [Halodesulfovibrio sp.]|jgi:2-polyprenyl-3-methyl-5-hydroxy-6-metoxy-1,4-benzoquinol methylase|uniref:class I SAM-dependent methyltransferase n=1 Tax=Halodesulfovibrio sp. TaxID=1912772 RepID=UPI0025DB20E3|nr:class I SAM-dependent methyltransferase [Halodesulfovibrio sp.]MCT4535884.1 methyltransferase domain-containing protein [Halodesulfovibrio sp.]
MDSGYSVNTAEMWDYFFEDAETVYDVELYLNLLSDQQKSTGTTLDVGCGTGRFSLPLHQQGHKVVGIDSSEPMLDIFKSKVQNIDTHPELVHTAFEDFAPSHNFDGIVAFYLMQFMLDRTEAITFFKKAHSLLAPDGVFLFSVYNSLGIWNPAGWSLTHTRELEEGFARAEYVFNPIDNLKGIVKAADYRVLRTNGSYAIDYYTKLIRLYSLAEYKIMLQEAGFNNIQVFVDNKAEPITDADQYGIKLYIAARK